MTARRKRGRINRDQTFDEFLSAEGLMDKCEELAIKEIIAHQIKLAIDKKGLSQ